MSVGGGSDAHQMKMLEVALAAEQENLQLREELAASKDLQSERNRAMQHVDELQLQLDRLQAEQNGMAKHVMSMVDDRAALRAARVQLEHEREDFELQKLQAADAIAYAAQMEQSERALKRRTHKLEAELQLYTTKCCQLTEAYLELEQTLGEKQHRVALLIREKAHSEMQIKLLQNQVDDSNQQPEMLEKLRDVLRKQIEENGGYGLGGTAVVMSLRTKVDELESENHTLKRSSERMKEQIRVQASTIEALTEQVAQLAQKLTDSNAKIDKLASDLDVSVGKEVHKAGLNTRLSADISKRDHTIRVLRQQVDNAEVEKTEALAKLAEQVHMTSELNLQRQRLLIEIDLERQNEC